ncbi:helix-turn-helix domain-containing protein [Halorientalis halophila]|uniref:helix-turn-helix domain-containing protein n=1 Tax=Halorientalis halophila TaxID=3108499 RepID=UPI00300A87BB
MREFNIVLRAEDGTYNPLDEAIVEHPELSREAALHFDLMPDGTSVLLYHIDGDAEDLEAILAAEDSALSYDVFEVEGDGLRAHVRFAANTVLSAMIQLMDEYDLIVDPPVDIDDEGGLHMQVAGEFKKIREAAQMRPGQLDIELEEDDSGGVDRVDVTTMLTERQLEVLEVALEKGYYEIPRQATNEDIAADLDCSTSTVGEHLRKIESRIISQVGPD